MGRSFSTQLRCSLPRNGWPSPLPGNEFLFPGKFLSGGSFSQRQQHVDPPITNCVSFFPVREDYRGALPGHQQSSEAFHVVIFSSAADKQRSSFIGSPGDARCLGKIPSSGFFSASFFSSGRHTLHEMGSAPFFHGQSCKCTQISLRWGAFFLPNFFLMLGLANGMLPSLFIFLSPDPLRPAVPCRYQFNLS